MSMTNNERSGELKVGDQFPMYEKNSFSDILLKYYSLNNIAV